MVTVRGLDTVNGMSDEAATRLRSAHRLGSCPLPTWIAACLDWHNEAEEQALLENQKKILAWARLLRQVRTYEGLSTDEGVGGEH